MNGHNEQSTKSKQNRIMKCVVEKKLQNRIFSQGKQIVFIINKFVHIFLFTLKEKFWFQPTEKENDYL